MLYYKLSLRLILKQWKNHNVTFSFSHFKTGGFYPPANLEEVQIKSNTW